MSVIGYDTMPDAARGFGRARPGQIGVRRSSLALGSTATSLEAPFETPFETPHHPPPRGLRDWHHPLARRYDRWCRAIEAWQSTRPLPVDLCAKVGSRSWFAGLGRLVLFVAPALLCLPSFAAFEAAPLPVPDDGAVHELQTAAIHPRIAGAATGRHYAATDLVTRLDSVAERATIGLNAVIGEHDDLARMLQRLGLASADATTVKTLIAPVVPADGIAPGTHLAVTLGARAATGEPRPLITMAFRPSFAMNVTIARQSGGLMLIKQPIPVDSTPVHLVGAAGSSLYRAARAAGAAPATVQAYLQAIDQYMPFEAIAPTDQFELVVAHQRAVDGARNADSLDAGHDGDLLYAGVIRAGKPLLQVMRWGKDGNFYTPDALAGAAQSESGLLAAPVAGNITSWFGMRRHPILGYVRMHAGVDFGATYGSPIFAVSAGLVTYAGWHGGHGNYVRLDHGGGIDTGYGHMSRIAVAMGSRVTRGQVIGYVGSTGLSTGPHLHYELFRGGQPVDPLSIRFVPHHSSVDPAELASFRARMHQLLGLPHAGGRDYAGMARRGTAAG